MSSNPLTVEPLGQLVELILRNFSQTVIEVFSLPFSEQTWRHVIAIGMLTTLAVLIAWRLYIRFQLVNQVEISKKPTLLKFMGTRVFAGLVLTLILQVPLVGVVSVLIAYPVFFLFPEFARDGAEVGYSFAWIYLKTTWSWFIFCSYFTLFVLVAGLFLFPLPETKIQRHDL